MDEWFKVDTMPVRTQRCWPKHTHTHTFHTIWDRITFQKLSRANFWAGHQIAVKSPSLTNMWEKANKDHVYVAKENSSFLSFHLLFFFIHSLMWESVHRDVTSVMWLGEIHLIWPTMLWVQTRSRGFRTKAPRGTDLGALLKECSGFNNS